MDNVVQAIRKAGVVTTAIRERYFHGKSVSYMRSWLEQNGLDKHMPIELKSTEICIITPLGILMQIRPEDNNQMGMWGGVLNDDESPKEGAVRKLKEELNLEVSIEELEFVEENNHKHEYGNGDKAVFHAYRFKLEMDDVPKFKTSSQFVVQLCTHNVLSHQHEFMKRMLGEK